MPKVFLTGATGYIGGHTFQLIANKHPEWDITALVRNESQANNIRKSFPSIRIVVGSLEDLDLVGRLAAEMDVVLHLASSPSLLTSTNIISGMACSKKAPATFIQLSSLGTLQSAPNGYGNASPIVYNDDDEIPLTSQIPPHCPEHAVLAAGRRHGVTTAIVCPSLIYGVSKGPVRKRGTTVPMLIEAILKRGRGFVVGEGKNEMSCIHINDVASALLTLTEHAPAHQTQQTRSTTTTTNTAIDSIKLPLANIYFLTSPSPPISMLSLTHSILTVLSDSHSPTHTHNPNTTKLPFSLTTETKTEIDHLPTSHSTQIHPWAPLLWGSNLIGTSNLLHALGWRTHGPSLLCALSEMVDFEIELLAARDEDVFSAWRTDVEGRRLKVEGIVRCF